MIARSKARLTRRQMAWRCAQNLLEGNYVNVGIGLPGLVPQYVPAGREVIFQSENGVLGVGPAPPAAERDPDLINAGKEPISLLSGGAFFHHTDAFVMIRGGHIDIALLGAFQVSAYGDLANWRTDRDDRPPAVGGAMDLAVGAKEIWVLMEHTASDGTPRILSSCTYPLTAARVVKRVFTDLAEFTVDRGGLLVTGMVEGLSLEDLQAATGAPLRLAERCDLIHAPELESNA